MNRYPRGPTIGGPSKATASTTCQKCLKKGHYSYECKAVVQERPYVSRPSRTQQLLNPNLVPKLTSDVPQDLLRKKGIADEQLAKAELERGRKRERQSDETETTGVSKRMRSNSASSASVSTISTDLSRPPSPRQSYTDQERPRPRTSSFSQSPTSKTHSRQNRRFSSISLSPPTHAKVDSEKKRRRDSISSVDSESPDIRRDDVRNSRERENSRSTRRRYQHHSPEIRGRRTESRSPYRGRRRHSNGRGPVGDSRNGEQAPRDGFRESRAPPRERSLSPFSKRLALTQAMNMGQ